MDTTQIVRATIKLLPEGNALLGVIEANGKEYFFTETRLNKTDLMGNKVICDRLEVNQQVIAKLKKVGPNTWRPVTFYSESK